MPIVGFLIAGVVIGPHALRLVDDPALVNDAAEIGVILLLFTIGIEFSLEKLWRIKTLIFGGGGLQVTLASLAVLAVPDGVRRRVACGAVHRLPRLAVVDGDRAEAARRPGRDGVASRSGDARPADLPGPRGDRHGPGRADARRRGRIGRADRLGAGQGAGLIIVAVLVVARRLMPPLLERVALTCSPELFLLTVIAICFGTAWLTSIAGVSLSLGAFLAGLVVSESRFSHHAFGEIMPLQILFSATFFVSVGMLLDVGFLVHHLPLVLAAVALVVRGEDGDDRRQRARARLQRCRSPRRRR